MLGTDGRPAPQRIPLHFLDAVVLVLFLGAAVHQYFGSPGLMVLNLTVSALLTAALVLFYFRRIIILESQRDLLTHELNQETR